MFPWIKYVKKFFRFFFTIERSLISGFLVVITIGTILLILPAASSNGNSIGFLNALFTSTSAVCVTGLTVVDTGKDFTTFGQIVILSLIQIGGLGIMTFSIMVIYLLEGKLSIANRFVLQQTFSQGPFQNLRSLVKVVFIATFVIEFVGAAVLTWRFSYNMPFSEAAYSGIFHAVSAFCNAGFSLYSNSLYNYHADTFVNFIVIALIISGGISFIVMYDIYSTMRKKTKLSLNSKIVILVSGVAIVVGTVLFYFLERTHAFQGDTLHIQLLESFFNSVSARTAGFATVDIGLVSSPSLLIFIFLMFIGGSPGSCAGGIKTTTFAIIIASIIARFNNREDTNLFKRRIPAQLVSKAITIVFFTFTLVLISTTILLISDASPLGPLESRAMFLEYLFEVVSAMGTVGLSTGITPTLSVFGKILITLLMFIGRLGPITIVMAVGRKEESKIKYAQENILIG